MYSTLDPDDEKFTKEKILYNPLFVITYRISLKSGLIYK